MTSAEMILLGALFLHRMTAPKAGPSEAVAHLEQVLEARSANARTNTAEHPAPYKLLAYLHDLRSSEPPAGRSSADPVDPGFRRESAARTLAFNEIAFCEFVEAMLFADRP